ncbi:hypothetical protein P3342_011167 [Pyrenophora teres f. teres]|nr:hypothetical protein P3342_011167 [Pyrenophora teres f. teres]
MATALEVARLVLRQSAEAEEPVVCSSSNDYDGRMGVRISSIFVILVASSFGAVFPVFAKRRRHKLVPNWVFSPQSISDQVSSSQPPSSIFLLRQTRHWATNA